MNSTFIENTARYGGGAVFIETGKSNFTNSTFIKNQIISISAYSGGAVQIYGGGHIHNFIDCKFIENNATEHGGAVYIKRAKGNFTNTVFTSNYAKRSGGAVMFGISECNFTNSIFTRNSAYENGGAIAIEEDSKGVFINNIFLENNARKNGGAVYIYSGSTSIFTNSNFTANKGEYG